MVLFQVCLLIFCVSISPNNLAKASTFHRHSIPGREGKAAKLMETAFENQDLFDENFFVSNDEFIQEIDITTEPTIKQLEDDFVSEVMNEFLDIDVAKMMDEEGNIRGPRHSEHDNTQYYHQPHHSFQQQQNQYSQKENQRFFNQQQPQQEYLVQDQRQRHLDEQNINNDVLTKDENINDVLIKEQNINDILTKEQNINEVLTRDGDDDNEDDVVCVDKVMEIEETVYDEKVKCQHTFTQKCHDSFITDFVPTQERKCETSYTKNCHITYEPQMYEEKVDVCSEPLEKTCSPDIRGHLPDICNIHYETDCETRYKEHVLEQDEPVCQMVNETRCNSAARNVEGKENALSGSISPVDSDEFANKLFGEEEDCEIWPIQKCEVKKVQTKKVQPETSCKKTPKEICAPSNCKLVKAEKVCRSETRNVIQNIPGEECALQPQQTCNMETVLVPKLVERKNCVDVPKEICVNEKTNPRKVKRPIVKEWCYKKSDLRSPESKRFLRQMSSSIN